MKIEYVDFCEDSTNVLIARLTSHDGSGAATGVKGEGYWLQQADFSTITAKVFNRSGTTPDTALSSPTVTISTSIKDTPVTSTALWKADTTGYNFIHDIADTAIPTSDDTYRVEYRGVLASGTVIQWGFEGKSNRVIGS